MDGKNPVGATVGLLDAHSVWCYMVDPFTEKLKFNIEIKGGVAQARNPMIKKLVKGDGFNLQFLAKARGELKNQLDLEELEIEASQEQDDGFISKQ
jgi:hypothetical protein